MKIFSYWLTAIVILYSSNLCAMHFSGAQDDLAIKTVKQPVETFSSRQPSLDLMTQVNYPNGWKKHSLRFVQSRMLCNDPATKERGVALLRAIAKDKVESFPPAQLKLAQYLDENFDSPKSYKNLRDAAFGKFPLAEALYGWKLIDRGYEDCGLKMVHRAIEPRTVKFIDRKGRRRHAHYQEPLAAEMLALYYVWHPTLHLSEHSLYFTDLAFKLTNDQKWVGQKQALLGEMDQLPPLAPSPLPSAAAHPTAVLQPIAEQQQQELKPKPLSAQECIAKLEAGEENDSIIVRLRQLVDSDDEALPYVMMMYTRGDRGVESNARYVLQLLERLNERNLSEKLSWVDLDDLRVLARQSKDASFNYLVGKLFYEHVLVTGNNRNAPHKAIACLKRVPRDATDYIDAQWCLFRCYVQSNQPDCAMAIVRSMIDSDSSRDNAAQIAEALALLEEKFPGQPTVAFFLAELFAVGAPNIVAKNEKKSFSLYEAAAKLNHPGALKWLADSLALAARNSFENNITIGIHRHQHAKKDSDRLLQSIDQETVKELERIAQSRDDSVCNRILGYLKILKAKQITAQQQRAQMLKEAYGFLANCKPEQNAYLLKGLEEQIGSIYDEINQLAKAEKYLRLAHQKGSEGASYRLLRLLIKKHAVDSDAFTRGLDLAGELIEHTPDIVFYVVDHFKPKSAAPALEQRVNELLKQAAAQSSYFAGFLLHTKNISFLHADPQDLQERLCVQLKQGDGDACFQMGMAYYFQNNYAQAVAFLKRAHQAQHPFAQFYLAFGLTHLEQLGEVPHHFGSFLASVEDTGLETGALKEQAESFLNAFAKRGNVESFKQLSGYYLRCYREKSDTYWLIRCKELIARVIVEQWLNSDQKFETELNGCLPFLEQLAELDGECAWHLASVSLRMHQKDITFPGGVDKHTQVTNIKELFNRAHRAFPLLRNEEQYARLWANCLVECGLSFEQKQQFEEAASAYHQALKLSPKHLCVSGLAALYFNGKTKLKGTASWRRGIDTFEEVAQQGNEYATAQLVQYYRNGARFLCGGAPLRPNQREAARYQKLVSNSAGAATVSDGGAAADAPSSLDNDPSQLLKRSIVLLDPRTRNVEKAFELFKASLDAGLFSTPAGAAAFARACSENDILEQLKTACDQTKATVAKQAYAYCLGELYYTLIISPTVSFSQQEMPELIDLCRKYLNTALSSSIKQVEISTLSLLTLLCAKELESKEAEDEKVKCLRMMFLFMTKALKNRGDEKNIPYLNDASFKLGYIASRTQLSIENQAALAPVGKMYTDLLDQHMKRAVETHQRAAAAGKAECSSGAGDKA